MLIVSNIFVLAAERLFSFQSSLKVEAETPKAKLDDFFGLTLSFCCITWLNSVTVVEKWHHSLINWSSISPVFTVILSLPPGRGFRGKIKNQWRSLYAALRSDRWRRYELIGSPCSDSPLTTAECLQSHRQSARARAETDQFTLLQLSLQPFGLSLLKT